MKTIANAFQENHKVLIPFITAGDPSLEETKQLIKTLAENGGDIIEIGVPFSASLADGPIIQDSYVRALSKGTNIYQIFEMCKELRTEGVEVPLVLMVSCNIIIRVGLSKFFSEAAASGIQGTIIPDVPLEEVDEFEADARVNNIDIILLAAPTTEEDRLQSIVKTTQGFLYYISSMGITGERASFAKTLQEKVSYIKSFASIPVGVGFGISQPEQAKTISSFADAVIIGSSLVRLIHEAPQNERIARAGDFIRTVKEAMTS